MKSLKKSLLVFIFAAFAGNLSAQTPTNVPTTPVVAKTQNASLFRRACSKVADAIKAGASFVKNNPKKCIAVTATAVAAISAVAMYWYLKQIPATASTITPANSTIDSLIKFINESSDSSDATCPINQAPSIEELRELVVDHNLLAQYNNFVQIPHRPIPFRQ